MCESGEQPPGDGGQAAGTEGCGLEGIKHVGRKHNEIPLGWEPCPACRLHAGQGGWCPLPGWVAGSQPSLPGRPGSRKGRAGEMATVLSGSKERYDREREGSSAETPVGARGSAEPCPRSSLRLHLHSLIMCTSDVAAEAQGRLRLHQWGPRLAGLLSPAEPQPRGVCMCRAWRPENPPALPLRVPARVIVRWEDTWLLVRAGDGDRCADQEAPLQLT